MLRPIFLKDCSNQSTNLAVWIQFQKGCNNLLVFSSQFVLKLQKMSITKICCASLSFLGLMAFTEYQVYPLLGWLGLLLEFKMETHAYYHYFPSAEAKCSSVSIQGDPNQKLQLWMAVTLKVCISDPMLVKPKWVWWVSVFCEKRYILHDLGI